MCHPSKARTLFRNTQRQRAWNWYHFYLQMSCNINFTYLELRDLRSILANMIVAYCDTQLLYLGYLSQPPHCAGTVLANVNWHQVGFGLYLEMFLYCTLYPWHQPSLSEFRNQQAHAMTSDIGYAGIHYKYIRVQEGYGLGSPSGEQVLIARDHIRSTSPQSRTMACALARCRKTNQNSAIHSFPA